MMRPMVSGIVGNIAILLAIALTYKTLRPGEGREPKTFGKIGVGFLLGLIGTLLIFQGASFAPNSLFHVPSILFLLSGLFFGAVPTVTAVALTSLSSVYQGGAGAWAGVCGTLVTALVGLLWKKLRGSKRGPFSLAELYLAGLTAHLSLLLSMMVFSREALGKSFPLVLLHLLGLFPLVTMLLGKLMANRDLRWETETKVREGEERFRTLYMDASLGIDRRLGREEREF